MGLHGRVKEKAECLAGASGQIQQTTCAVLGACLGGVAFDNILEFLPLLPGFTRVEWSRAHVQI